MCILAFCIYLPMIAQPSPMRGTAGCGGVGQWCYSYWPHDTVDDSKPYQVVPLIRGADVGPFRVGASKLALVFNEPSNCDPLAGDCLTPTQAATIFWQDVNQLPDAKIICCGDYGTPVWTDAFLTACACLSRLTGISFHNYVALDSPATLDGWVSRTNTWVSWIHTKNGPYPTRSLEIWLTEMGWNPCCEVDEQTALQHMQLLCTQLPSLSLTRYAWYIGQYQPGNIALLNSDGTPNALGQQWGTC